MGVSTELAAGTRDSGHVEFWRASIMAVALYRLLQQCEVTGSDLPRRTTVDLATKMLRRLLSHVYIPQQN